MGRRRAGETPRCPSKKRSTTHHPTHHSACYAYGRSFNPTTRALGRLLAALEGTEAGYATASGLSAIAAVIMNLCDAGDAVVSSATVYGGTYALLHDFLPRKAGVRTVFVDTSDMSAVKNALATTPNVKCLYVETLSNPVLAVADIPALADAAHAAGVPLVVDNTFAPCAVTPAKWGADIVVSDGGVFVSSCACFGMACAFFFFDWRCRDGEI